MSVIIIDYGSGNLHSAHKAFERAASESGVNVPIRISADIDQIKNADRIVLPGVGAFGDCRAGLDAIEGLVETLDEIIIKKARPFLGICVGTQLMSQEGVEKKHSAGLGWIEGKTVMIKPDDPQLKIPQIGWNTLEADQPHQVLDDIPLGTGGWHAYFVHSYHVETRNSEDLIATTDYGGQVSAIIGRDNYVGTQFHPEKSQKLGLKLIANFLKWKP